MASSKFDLNTLGHVVVGTFVGPRAIAALAWRAARIDERWSVEAAQHGGSEPS